MAGYCVSFLFYSYFAATIVYLLFGIFASTGNGPLLIEHYKLNSTSEVDGDEKDVKKRTYSQYFFASSLTLVLTVVLYIFCMREQEKVKEPFTQTISLDIAQENNILNQPENDNINRPIEMAQPNNSSEQIHTINTVSSLVEEKGMGENEI